MPLDNPHSEAKAAHAAAYFLKKAGGRLELLKLMKLMYLAERTSYERFGEPMIGDQPFADRHGPVLNGVYQSAAYHDAGPTWQQLITPRHGIWLRLVDDNAPLKKLSQADRDILDGLWGRFGGMSASTLRNWTHNRKNVPEYDEKIFKVPDHAPRCPISLRSILVNVGFSEEDADAICNDLETENDLNRQLAPSA